MFLRLGGFKQRGRMSLLLLFVLLGLQNNLKAQSGVNDEAFLDACAEKIDDYNFLKAYKIGVKNLKKGKESDKKEYSYVLSKDTEYLLTVCTKNGGSSDIRLVLNIYDRNRKLIKSSYQSRRHQDVVKFTCGATGVYYFEYYFIGEGDGLGVSILAAIL